LLTFKLDPARDFGPRLFTLLAGYGWSVFSHRQYMWFLIPIVCPFVGGLFGSVIYQLVIGIQVPDEQEIPSLTPSMTNLIHDTSKSALNSLV
jgi:hypothetical protein